MTGRIASELWNAEQKKAALDSILGDIEAALVMCSQLDFATKISTHSIVRALESARAAVNGVLPEDGPEDEMQYAMRTTPSDR